MKVAIYTLGCKVNQYETQAMEQTLRAKGHQVVEFSNEADAYVVNTCSVTAVSDQKSRQVIHRYRSSTRRRWWQCAAAIPRPIRRMCGSWGRISSPAPATGGVRFPA